MFVLSVPVIKDGISLNSFWILRKPKFLRSLLFELVTEILKHVTCDFLVRIELLVLDKMVNNYDSLFSIY